MNDCARAYSIFATLWAEAMGRACWQGGLALLLAWLLCRLPRLPAQFQCWLWRLAYMKLLIALFWAHPINLPLLPVTEPPSESPAIQITALPPQTYPALSLRALRTEGQPMAVHDFSGIWNALLALWLAGGLRYASRAVWDWNGIRRLRACCQPLDDPQFADICAEQCALLGLRRCPELLQQAEAGYPQLVGLIRPAIILPEAFWNDCTEAQQRLILLHEMSHLRRRDLLWAWMPFVGRCLFYFLPPVWLAEREWQQSQEMACDEQVLRLATAPRSEYGSILLKITLLPRPDLTSGLVAMRIAESYSVVQRRLLAMKHAGKTPRRTLLAVGTLVTAVGVIGIVPWRVSAQNTPQKGEADTTQRVNKEAAAQNPGGEAGLMKGIAEQLQLSGEQAKRAHAIAATGAQQVMRTLTPEQRQMTAPKGTGWSDVLAALNLTDAQKIKMKTLIEQQEQQKRAVKFDESLTPEERGHEVKRIEEQRELELRQILTPEQQAQLAASLKQQEEAQNWLHVTSAQQAKMSEMKLDFAKRMDALSNDATLSDAERQGRMIALKRGLEQQVAEVLTPEQRQLMAAHEQQQQVNREVGLFHLANLERVDNLAPAQRSHIQAIYNNVEKQFEQLLTPQQKEKLQQLLRDSGKAQ